MNLAKSAECRDGWRFSVEHPRESVSKAGGKKKLEKSVTIGPVERLILWKAGIVGMVADDRATTGKATETATALLRVGP